MCYGIPLAHLPPGTRFRLATKRLGLNERHLRLRTDLFQRPVAKGGQFSLL